MKWSEMDFRVNPTDRRNFAYAPHGDFDYLALSSPVLSIVPCERVVVIEACDGVYVLSGCPDDFNTWMIEKVMHQRA